MTAFHFCIKLKRLPLLHYLILLDGTDDAEETHEKRWMIKEKGDIRRRGPSPMGVKANMMLMNRYVGDTNADLYMKDD